MIESTYNGMTEVLVVSPEKCKFCGSKKIVRYGYYRGVQRWWCKDCLRKFVHNDALPGMRTPVVQVASALNMFYEGMSLMDIKKNLEQTYKTYLSNSTIYEWVLHFTKIATKATYYYRPEVGDIWVADVAFMKVGGTNLWFLDLFDSSSKFLLSYHLCMSRTTRDARILVERAAERTKKAPKVIIADKLRKCLDGVEFTNATDRHFPATRLPARPCPQLIERFRSTLETCAEITRRLKTLHSVELVTGGWLVHYNFFKPNKSLKYATPAEKAGIKFPFKSWLDIVRGEIAVA